ncbi:hypothetical protein FXN63_24340 [Pigmentiphaga aceris]|uniref:Alpha/beta hydrolase n=1 Tax=Pigmentiphaga aceris TaxID=1940612 RepID=A0A5C0B6U2_9BURK|nr:hypothetical protein FXN63_24340 [Pigmentiphaga aceris]
MLRSGAGALLLACAASSVNAATPAATPVLNDIADAYAISLGAKAGALNYFVSRRAPGSSDDTAVSALVAFHGHPRDAGRTLAAGELAARQAGRVADTLIVAPLFQVASPASERCQSAGVPAAQPGDALWTCSSWMAGGTAKGSSVTSFAALDQLLADLKRRWPRLQTVTVTGFSAGAQFVQRYIAFANPPAGLSVRYVVADPSSWLYFDDVRPAPQRNGQPVDWRSCTQTSGESACSYVFAAPATPQQCPDYASWKYGIADMPATLGRTASEARQRYAQADVAYLQGALDMGDGPGTAYRLLDKTCGAQLQGPYRLQRGLAYLAYDQHMLSPQKKRSLTVVPGCAHNVSCVFPSAEAAPVLFPTTGR